MTVFVLLGSDDYRCREILGVFHDRKSAEDETKVEKPGGHLLISRQSEPSFEIQEFQVL